MSDLDILSRLETVELVEELEHGALNLRVAATRARATNAIDLIHEDDAWSILTSHHEELADHATALTDIFLDELRARDTDEGAIRVVRDSTSEQSLT